MNVMISMVLWWIPIVSLALLFHLIGKGPIRWSWMAAAVAVFAVYTVIVFYASSIPGFPSIPGAQYNWTGKFAAIMASLVMIILSLRSSNWVTPQRLGLTFQQNKGSVLPALVATGAMIGFVVFLQLVFAKDGAQADLETLAYQAIIPGMDEELMFRGLLLTLLAGAFMQMKRNWLWAGICATIIFALGHSFFWSDQGPQFDPVALFYTAILGGLMMFIRIRTGSILLPIIAHNLTNVANKLV